MKYTSEEHDKLLEQVWIDGCYEEDFDDENSALSKYLDYLIKLREQEAKQEAIQEMNKQQNSEKDIYFAGFKEGYEGGAIDKELEMNKRIDTTLSKSVDANFQSAVDKLILEMDDIKWGFDIDYPDGISPYNKGKIKLIQNKIDLLRSIEFHLKEDLEEKLKSLKEGEKE